MAAVKETDVGADEGRQWFRSGWWWGCGTVGSAVFCRWGLGVLGVGEREIGEARLLSGFGPERQAGWWRLGRQEWNVACMSEL